MSDLTDTLRLIARAGAGQKQIALDHYRQVLLEAQQDYDAQELLHADPYQAASDLCRSLETDYEATMERIDARQDPEYAKWLDRINQFNDEQPDPTEDQGYDDDI